MPPVCNGICLQYRAQRPMDGKRYTSGQKRCKSCSIFIHWDGIYCPCCNYKLRKMPTHTKYRVITRSSMSN